jgi:hypothetical protein
MAGLPSKIIRLERLNPSNYRLWAAQSESTFEVHGVLDIVLGNEPHPSITQAAAIPGDIAPPEQAPNAAQRRTTAAAITKWESQNALARQALLACLEPAELTKVYRMKSSHDIWQRLSEEYGAISHARLAHAEAAFYTLQKQPETSLQTHINEFTALQQEVDYHRGTNPLLSNIQINLAFLHSLGDDWKSFQKSLGNQINTLKPATLFAEVLAFHTPTDEPNPPVLNALLTKGPQQHQRRAWKKPKKPHTNTYFTYDRSKFCSYCKRNGHDIRECLKKKWKDTQEQEMEQKMDARKERREDEHEYQPRWKGE